MEFHIFATSKVISGRVPTCDSAHSLRLYSVVPLRNQVGQLHHDPISQTVALSWHWANQSLPYPINTKCQIRKRYISILYFFLIWLDRKLNSRSPTHEIKQNKNKHHTRLVHATAIKGQTDVRDPPWGLFHRTYCTVNSYPQHIATVIRWKVGGGNHL